MKRITIYLGITIWYLLPVQSFSQTETVTDLVEHAAESLETEGDVSTLAEDLEELSRKPVRLNAAVEDDLETIPFLTPARRKALSDYLITYGEVLSLFELRSIPGFDSSLVMQISPYISVGPVSRIPRPTPGNLVKHGRQELLIRYSQTFPKAAGYGGSDSLRMARPGDYYAGSPQRYYFRYQFNWFDRLRIGFAGEKDPGEQFFRGAQKYGMDFYAGYIALENTGIIKSLVVGSFRASFGQGLTFGSGSGLGSAPGFSRDIPMAKGIRPAMAMSEGSYLRGLGVTLKSKPLVFSGFISYHPRDATVADDTLPGAEEVFSSLDGTGYHRTPQEIAKHNTMKELVAGGNVGITLAPSQQFGFRAGLTGAYMHYSARLEPSLKPYNQFIFSGKDNFCTGIDLQAGFRGQYLFGEVSRSRNGGMAWLAGVVLTPDPSATITVICRNYQRHYQNPFSSAFGQGSQNAGEKGIYAAIKAAPGANISLAGYLDLFAFPWLRYRVDRPSQGYESGMMTTWNASRNVIIGLRFTRKNKPLNDPAETGSLLHHTVDRPVSDFRLTVDWLPGGSLLLKTRAEVREAGSKTSGKTYGYLVSQDLKLKDSTSVPDFTLRFTIFDIPDYDTRIYMVEPQVLYGYSVPAFQGRGVHGCCLVKAEIGRRLNIWLRGGVTIYTDRDSIGSGADLTRGNIRGDLTLQLLYRLR